MSNFIEHPLVKQKRIQSRIYQQVLFVEAIKSNTLIILPTGLGKTIIMVMVAARYLNKEPKHQIVLIAPTRPLVDQHASTFKDMLNINSENIIIISGETPPSKRKVLWEQAKVVIATPQTLRNDIVSEICDLKRVSVMCLDEIHRAVGDDPYVLPVQQYLLQNPNGRVLGFTASPGNKRKLREIVSNAGITNIQYMDEENPQVKPYTHETVENWIHIDLPDEILKILKLLSEYTKQNLKILKKIEIIKSSQIIKNPRRELVKIPSILNLKRSKIDENDFFAGMTAYGQLMLVTQASEMLETQGLNTLKAYFNAKKEEKEKTKKNSLKRFLTNSLVQKAIDETNELLRAGFAHPKLIRLKQIISNTVLNKEDSRVLVFANYKATTNFLVKELNKIDKVRGHRFVGQSSTRYGEGLKQKEQKSVMDQFRNGNYNLLVSTSVGEEGLDVAQCDLVIFYDVTPSSTRLIQRSGRTGRVRKGKVIIFITKGTREEGYFYSSQQQKKKIKASVLDIVKELREKNLIQDETIKNSNVSLLSKEKEGLELFLEEDIKVENKEKVSNNPTGKNEMMNNTLDSSLDELSFIIPNSKPIIYIDHREKGSGLLRELMKLDIELKQTTLPIGDFVLSNRVGIERKTITDFCKTLIRNELFEQLINLKLAYPKPILILEGENIFGCSLNPSSIRGAIASISIDYDIPIIRTINHVETANMLLTIAKREQKDKTKRPQIRKASSGSLAEEQLFLISSLPNINRILAERLLNELKTPRDVFIAHPDSLRKVQGIGPNKADSIDILLSTPFDDADNL